MQRNAQLDSENEITLEPVSMVPPAGEPALRAAYVRLELSRFLTFEQAMSEPGYAIGIRNLADAIARRESPERIAEACDKHQSKYRLQFTQDFRAELQAAISAREQEGIDAS